MSKKKHKVKPILGSKKRRSQRRKLIKERRLPRRLRKYMNGQIQKAADIIDKRRIFHRIERNTLWLRVAKLIDSDARNIAKLYPSWNRDLTDACRELERRKKGRYTLKVKDPFNPFGDLF